MYEPDIHKTTLDRRYSSVDYKAKRNLQVKWNCWHDRQRPNCCPRSSEPRVQTVARAIYYTDYAIRSEFAGVARASLFTTQPTTTTDVLTCTHVASYPSLPTFSMLQHWKGGKVQHWKGGKATLKRWEGMGTRLHTCTVFRNGPEYEIESKFSSRERMGWTLRTNEPCRLTVHLHQSVTPYAYQLLIILCA